MYAWIVNNLATILICAVLILLIGIILFSMYRSRKKGNNSSCGGCSGCPMSNSCRKQ